jgi:hypothetical protein
MIVTSYLNLGFHIIIMSDPLLGSTDGAEPTGDAVDFADKPAVVTSENSTGAIVGITSDGNEYQAGDDIHYNVLEFGEEYKTDDSSPQDAVEISDEEARRLLENQQESVAAANHFYVTEVFQEQIDEDEVLQNVKEAYREEYDDSFSGIPDHSQSLSVVETPGNSPEMVEDE